VNRPAVTRMPPPARQASAVNETHNIPQAPATLGAQNPNTAAGASGAHNVPRPPDRGTTNAPSNAGYASHPGYSSQPGYPSQPGYGSQSASQHVVPKPPNAGGATPITTNAATHNTSGNNGAHVATPQHQATSVAQPAASTPHNQQPSKPSGSSQPRESKSHEAAKSNPGMASANVPRPPSGYSYHAAPAYSASSYSVGSASYGGSARSYSASASTYGSSGRNSYSAAPTSQSYHPGATYSAAPSYSARASAQAPQHYSAPSAPAPHYSGGGGGGQYSGGGNSGGSQASSGHSAGHSR
jgi:hypothetical protein